MSLYSLEIQFLDKDLDPLTGQFVTVVKQVVNEVGELSGSEVIWLAIKPIQMIQISWEESYGLYVSQTEVKDGATIALTALVDTADPGYAYIFNGSELANPVASTTTDYEISSTDSGTWSCGVMQAVDSGTGLSDPRPLNAVTIASHETALFTPIEKVSVYLQGAYTNGVINSIVVNPVLTVDLTTDQNQIIHYDQSSGQFQLGPLPAAVASHL